MQALFYLASSRVTKQDSHHRSHRLFDREGHAPFGELVTVNDEALAPNRAAHHTVSHPATAIVVPLVGDVEVGVDDNATRIAPGQAAAIGIRSRQVLQLRNPYHEELISYLYLVVEGASGPLFQMGRFDPDVQRNQLAPVFGTGMPKLHVGLFDGRRDGVLSTPGKRVFALAIEGVFEVQDRLLHPRDALALADVGEVAFEALSNNALLLMLELPEKV